MCSFFGGRKDYVVVLEGRGSGVGVFFCFSIWRRMADVFETENGGDGAENSGLSTSGSTHGWHKVTNVKKQRRQAAKLSAGGGGQLAEEKAETTGKKTADSKVFQGLEIEAEKKRARRKARLEAVAAGDLSDSGEDDSGGEVGDKVSGPTTDDGEAKKLKVKKPKKPKVSVPEAAAAIDAEGLAKFLKEISESFKTLPDVQLVRCADYFARAFAPVSNEKFTWNKILRESPVAKSIEIPFVYIPEPVVKITSDWLAQKPVDELSKFAVWLLKEFLDEPQHKKASSPTKSKVGLLVVLALLLRKKPDVLLPQAPVVRAQFQGSDKLHTLAWAYGQAAQGDLVAGMALWVQNLLPLAAGKSSNPVSRDITLQFVESVIFANLKKARTILLNGSTRRGERLVSPAAFDTLLRMTYPNETAKTKATERFQAVYPLIKELALAGTLRSKATRPVAQQLLPLSLHAAAEDNKSLQQEAISCFMWSLAQNPDCFKQWEKLHMDNLPASTEILKHINSHWKEYVGRLTPLDDLKKTLQAFSLKHRSALKSEDGDADLDSELKAAELVTKSLLRKTSRLPAFTTAVATIAVSVVAAYGFYWLSPEVNPWGWDGKLLLSKTHFFKG